MDLQALREQYYEDWVGNDLEFKGVDGYLYHGFLADWLEDGSLVFRSLAIISLDSNGARHQFDSWGESFWLVINSHFIAYLILTRAVESKLKR